MNPTQCRQFEIEIVDDILGNLPSIRSQALQEHLAECGSCRKLYAEWHNILEDDSNVEPTVYLYRRLKNRILRRQVKRKLLNPAVLWSTASIIVIGMFILAVTTIQSRLPLDSWERLPIATEDIPSFVTDDKKTVQYMINPQKGQLSGINGIIWVNGRRDEVYCYMQNVENNAGYDYQIWLVKPVKKENGGLLRVMEQYGELYLQQRNIQEVQQISISLEPKGGSLFPTTDDTILVDFNNRSMIRR